MLRMALTIRQPLASRHYLSSRLSVNALSKSTPLSSVLSFHPIHHSQHRGYIFLPSSFSEALRSLKTHHKERRVVLVKLLKGPRDYAKRTRDYAIKTREKTRDYAQRTLASTKKRSSTLRRSAQSRIKRYQHQSMESLQKYQERFKRKLYERREVVLQEYSREDWFDANGYPQTARDELTGRFVNPWSSESTNGNHSLWAFFKWRWERFKKSILQNNNASHSTTTIQQDTTSKSLEWPSPSPPNNAIRLTWIGHSTTLVEMSGFTLMTDPHFSQRAAPFQSWPFLARHINAPISPENLVGVDVCCISHDHYDHLDYESVQALKDKVKLWAVPLGIKEWLQVECGVCSNRIVELQWWESVRVLKQGDDVVVKAKQEENGSYLDTPGMKITCAPAQHWCSRTPWDRNVRLWCSWAIASTCGLKYYFGGDTGLPPEFPLHRQIGDLLGPFDLAALPIGAYEPSYFMADSHVNPREAVQIHKDLRSKKSVAVHWGTFALADEDHDEPPRLLQEAIGEEDGVDFVVVRQGESVESAARDEEESEGETSMDPKQEYSNTNHAEEETGDGSDSGNSYNSRDEQVVA